MSNEIVERLFGSFSILENAIIAARENLSSKPGVKPEVISRLDSYGELLSKQRILADVLRLLINDSRWSEVAQKIAVINGLLEMIRSDAKDVLASLQVSKADHEDEIEDEDIILC